MSESHQNPLPMFTDLNLGDPILRVLKELGYESPSPIQAAAIPIFMSNRDVLGQAQTGTGKTAAFALPILARIDIRQNAPQALVLAPTRELAIQVAEAFQRYATHIPGFHVLPIYGGQSYGPQLSALRRGVHVVVGTPGRVIDHIEKNTLDLSKLKTLVLDEADEMLRMGFIDDVETILQKTPESRQTALFSATMPSAIKRIAQTYLHNPAEVTIAAKTGTADNIRQRYWLVSGMHKLDALTRILEAEAFDGMIIFARTKIGTEELASKLQARGFSAAAINGDIQQAQRERTIDQLKTGKIDILVATDVAARGLDVDRISHVINYDVPHDPESYTHRIGRTGRAGRSGEAILFITPREKNLLKVIERATRQPVSALELPTIQVVNEVRIARFKDQISEALASEGIEEFRGLVEDYEREHNVPAVEIAAALAKMARGDVPLLLDKNKREPASEKSWSDERPARAEQGGRNDRGTDRNSRFERNDRPERSERPAFPKKERVARAPDPGMQTFRIEVGHTHGVKPGNIVGAIANEAGLESRYIGRIEIYDDFSTLDLPDTMPDDLLEHLQKVWVAGQQLRITRDGEAPKGSSPKNEAAKRERPARHEERPKRTPDVMDVDRFLSTDPVEFPAEKAEFAESPKPAKKGKKNELAMRPFRIEVGHVHGVKPTNIVGAIANEAGLEAKYIGRIEIFENYSVVDLPDGMPDNVFEQLKNAEVSGQKLRISQAEGQSAADHRPVDQRVPLSVPKRGGDRRVEEKTMAAQAPAKKKSSSGYVSKDGASGKDRKKSKKL